MRPTQAIARPLSTRIMQGAAGRYTRFPNKLHSRSIITLKDHLVRSADPRASGAALTAVLVTVLLEGHG